MDDLPPERIDEQRWQMNNGRHVSAALYPWVPVAQAQTQAWRWRPPAEGNELHTSATLSPPPPKERQLRVAVCVAGGVRALIHPVVWGSIERHVLGRPGGHAGLQRLGLFLVLGTGAEDHARRANNQPLDEQDYLSSAEGAWLLSTALAGLRPTAVKFVTDVARASCGVPPTGQFDKWADCVSLVRQHERTSGERFNVLWKVRPDTLWRNALVKPPAALPAGRWSGIAWLAQQIVEDRAHPLVSVDDITWLAHRSRWTALEKMRAGQLHCDPACAAPFWMWIRGIRSYCYMKAHFARHGIHHVDLTNGPASPFDTLTTRVMMGSGMMGGGRGYTLIHDRSTQGRFELIRPALSEVVTARRT